MSNCRYLHEVKITSGETIDMKVWLYESLHVAYPSCLLCMQGPFVQLHVMKPITDLEIFSEISDETGKKHRLVEIPKIS